MSDRKNPFPLPTDIGHVPGAENWGEMYPYYTKVQPEDDERFWFYNSMHFSEPMSAFDMITAESAYHAMGAYVNRVFAFPTGKGIDYRCINGRIYITANTATDPEEIQQRLAIFQERAGHYYENWDEIYVQWEKRMGQLIKEMNAIKIPELPEFEDEAVVKEAKGIAQNHYLRETYNEVLEKYSIMWQHHFEMLMLGYGAYVVFFQFCKQAFPEITDQTVARMVAGIDVLMFRPDDELKKLAKLAVKLGIEDVFTSDGNPDVILPAVEAKGDAGKQWLDALAESRDPWFNISIGDGFYHFERSWNDDLAVPLSALPHYIELVKKGVSLERPTEELRAERERIISEYRDLLNTDEEKGAFDQMLAVSHLVFPYVEDHKFYCEHWLTTSFFNKIREFGDLLEMHGIIEKSDDIFQMHHTEVNLTLGNLMNSWAAGSRPVNQGYWPPIIAERRRMLEVLKEWQAPPAIGPMPDNIEDPALQMLWGITTETLHSWAAPSVENENEIRGYAASAGCVEGVARVLRGITDFGEINEGEILVCPITHPSWSPLFSKIAAAVSDIGGTMSHMAIVAREYGMPAVVGTGEATKRIKNGQRIRVDGDSGVVTILE
ncbi:MAG: PEP-utilizing protein mobile subunit [Gammaproteobacteria bacterium]|jgi:pyruvate,water dikinase|nr:PEP-utilizing protein mobile subunit [Gammaproteobacteria bacterium]MBT6042242.1 PEP-utilizing protein mobile subunit [Gammaproteobacteria bacterium]